MGMNRFLQTKIFTENLPAKAISTTNSILSHLHAGRLRKAVSILFGSPYPFAFPLYTHLFKLCSDNRAIIEARKDARQLFDEMSQRDGGSWNALITAYTQGESSNEAMKLFLDMNRSGFSPSEVTFASVLRCCGDLLELGFSRVVHGFIVKVGLIGNVILASALVDVYGKCDEIVEARKMFDEIGCPNAVSWNVIVRRYLEVGDDRQAIFMFFQIIRAGVKPLSFTFSNALVACSSKQAFLEGIQIHSIAIKCRYGDDEKVATSFINMYMKCNDFVSARKIFDLLTYKDLFSWTSIISGYAMVGRFKEAEELFNEMPEPSNISWNAMLAGYVHFGKWDEAVNLIFMMCQETNDFDSVTLNLLLNVSTALLDIDFGKQVHARIFRCGLASDITVSNAIIDMYEKCAAQEQQ